MQPKDRVFVSLDVDTLEEAENYFWKSMMVGDTADNIKGIAGIGPANAERIISNKPLFTSLRAIVLDEYCTKYGEDAGIINFYINYRCLKIVDTIPLEFLQDVKLNNVEGLSE